ncbi:MAG TPA: hypothetical protein VIJ11_12400 [Galbitalea sp.]
MTPRLDQPVPVNYAFSVPIGVDVKGDVWSAVGVPKSADVFGSLKSVRVDARGDEVHVVILRRLT